MKCDVLLSVKNVTFSFKMSAFVYIKRAKILKI